jgi:sugar lactone lactonase YvrE
MMLVPVITTVAGTGTACAAPGNSCGDAGAATAAYLNNAQHVAVDSAGNLYIADNADNRVRKVTAATGLISTVAGNGTQCASPTATCGDGGAATSANLNYPNATVVDAAGNLYIADRVDNRVRKVSASTGHISTIAGTGTACSSPTLACGDGGAATSAYLNAPIDLALDGAGNLYIADYNDNRVRKVSAATGHISTIAGTGASCSSPTASCGDGGAATSAELNLVRGIAFDAQGNGYIADMSDNRIRKITAATGYISTIAGNGTPCSSPGNSCGDGGAAASANLDSPTNLAVDLAGNLYFSDYLDQRVRKVSAATGTISAFAGNGTQCAAATDACGDGATSVSANLYNPTGVAVDTSGNIYISDFLDNKPCCQQRC